MQCQPGYPLVLALDILLFHDNCHLEWVLLTLFQFYFIAQEYSSWLSFSGNCSVDLNPSSLLDFFFLVFDVLTLRKDTTHLFYNAGEGALKCFAYSTLPVDLRWLLLQNISYTDGLLFLL